MDTDNKTSFYCSFLFVKLRKKLIRKKKLESTSQICDLGNETENLKKIKLKNLYSSIPNKFNIEK